MRTNDAPTVTLPVPLDRRRLRDARAPTPLSKHVMVLASPGGRGLWCTTKGLGAFGLPELQTFGVPARFVQDWAATMTGIALTLLERWLDAARDPHAAFVELPAVVEVSAAVVARAYGGTDSHTRLVGAVRLRLDPSTVGDSFLTIGPMDGARTSTRRFVTALCTALLEAHDHAGT